MRYSYPAFFVLLLTSLVLSAKAQQFISLTQDDMPKVGDTLRLSLTTTVNGSVLTQTGPDQRWDFSGLAPATQRVARFENVATTPGFLPLAFGSFVGVNQANLATRQDLGPLAGAGLPLSEVYQFFNKSATDYRQVGYGAVVQGTALPVTYKSQQLQDVMYRFPLTYGRKDSSTSDFTTSVPSLAFLREKQKRVTYADGWGTLITPFGTFPVLRVVATLTTTDSISLQGQPGTVLPRLTREYKWLGKNQGIPLLQITTQVAAGREVVIQIAYRDVYRRIGGPLATRPLSESVVAVYPNPLHMQEPLRLALTAAGPATIVATDLAGRQLFQQSVTGLAQREVIVPAAALGAFRGVMLVQVHTKAGLAVRRVVRQ